MKLDRFTEIVERQASCEVFGCGVDLRQIGWKTVNIRNLWSVFKEVVCSPQRLIIEAAKKFIGLFHPQNFRRISPVGGTVAETRIDEAKHNPFISDELPPDVAQLSARYRERRITSFLLGRKNIGRQDEVITQTVRAFFDGTKSLRGTSSDELGVQISEYRDVYLNAPVIMNKYGIHFATGLFLFLITRRKRPTLIVESGVYKGLSTYVLSSACPTAELHAFDPNLNELNFRSASATYHAIDWMDYELHCSPAQSGMAFFDDHQCQARRIIEAYNRGFRHLIFDDGWPIEAVIGCGWPPIPSIDMVMNDRLDLNETVQWVEDGKIWTYVHDQHMQKLCAKARTLVSAAYDVPTLYRESGYEPTSALKYVELVP